MLAGIRILMPIAAAAIACEAVAEREIILGVAAFGILRAWWKDILDADELKTRKILERIARWAIFGGVVDAFWNAKSYEEYAACALLVGFLWLWRQGKLGGLWNAIRGIRLPEVKLSEQPKEDTAIVHRAFSGLSHVEAEDDASRKKEYEKEAEMAQKEYASFLERMEAFKSRYGVATARFEKLEGVC